MRNVLRTGLVVFLCATLVTASSIQPIASAVESPARAKVSITFDDGRASNINKAAPILAKYGLTASAFIVTNCVGMATVPNSCRSAGDVSYMNWDQITALKNTYGWEIGSHSVSHPYLASKDASDGQPNLLSTGQVVAEVRDSKATLAAHGFNATAFSSPYGDYSNSTLSEIAKYYSVHRGFADQNNNVWPYNDLVLNNMQVQTPVLPAAVISKIDYAIANKNWLILTLHDIVDTPRDASTYAYDWKTSYFEEVAAYIKQKSDQGLISSVNISAGSVSGSNMLAGGDFAGGLASGWRTDNTGSFVAGGSGGSFPSSMNSIQLKASFRQSHLFSSRAAVNSNSMYVFKSYLAITSIASGEVGYYIDEYDSSGNWISGQWKGAERTVYTEKYNFSYVPTSSRVSSAQLQIYMTPMTVLSGYLDNVEMVAVLSAPITQPPLVANLLTNSTFDNGLTGWRTDNSSLVKLDNSNHGAPENQINSVRAFGSNMRGHLFSLPVAVVSGKSYTLTQYINIISSTGGGLGFYIDEYNSNGDWISGKYLKWTSLAGSQSFTLNYTPTSSNVTKASYQLIVDGGSQIDAYFDNPVWQQQ